MIEHLSPQFRGKQNLMNLLLIILNITGLYLIVAWSSYSPLDNSWQVANSQITGVLNHAGTMGAWIADIGYVLFGRMAFLPPFSLFLSTLYLLFRKNALPTCWQMSINVVGFVLLLIGLSCLSDSLFPHTDYYLSGGIIGALWGKYLVPEIGIFGALFIAMCFTSIGFFSCSGIIFLKLLVQLYHWIIATDNTNEISQFPHNDWQNNESNEPLEEDTSVPESHLSSQDFENLIVAENNVVQEDEEDSFYPTSFSVTSTVDLPVVKLDEEDNIASNSEERMEKSGMVLPKIRLNPITESAIDNAPNRQIDSHEINPQADHIFPISQTEPPQIVQSSSLTNKDDKYTAELLKGDELKEAHLSHPIKNDSPQYPKGYGETLLHPLLQRSVNLDKPTTPLPALELLEEKKGQTQQITAEETEHFSQLIEQVLASFGIKVKVESVSIGPVVIRYEISLASGIKSSKITNLANDLARELMCQKVRITEAIPGKPYVGIETPNPYRQTVWLREVLASPAFQQSQANLPMALGKDLNGQPIVVDMAKMPHLLVAGQTGSGKSVGVNTMILSLLYKLTPEQLRFIMFDPKTVELSEYNGIPHLLTPVVTDIKKVTNALRWAVEEMERRYSLISHLGVRSIERYNQKIDQATEMEYPIPDPTWRPGDTMDLLPPPLTKLSYIVIIIDEFAELIITAGKQIEEYIMRIAQKARAVGIHLILATQRPSTDVITGVIKANIPSRIAFTVAGQPDSRTILDQCGAELLLGKGDMLYSSADTPDIVRIHGAFVTDEEITRVANDWKARGNPQYLDEIISAKETEDEKGISHSTELDPLFDRVAEFVIENNVTSISRIQRKFSLGYPRAARIVDQLEMQGILSPPNESNKRELLV